jgi:hypothetical protein
MAAKHHPPFVGASSCQYQHGTENVHAPSRPGPNRLIPVEGAKLARVSGEGAVARAQLRARRNRSAAPVAHSQARRFSSNHIDVHCPAPEQRPFGIQPVHSAQLEPTLWLHRKLQPVARCTANAMDSVASTKSQPSHLHRVAAAMLRLARARVLVAKLCPARRADQQRATRVANVKA